MHSNTILSPNPRASLPSRSVEEFEEFYSRHGVGIYQELLSKCKDPVEAANRYKGLKVFSSYTESTFGIHYKNGLWQVSDIPLPRVVVDDYSPGDQANAAKEAWRKIFDPSVQFDNLTDSLDVFNGIFPNLKRHSCSNLLYTGVSHKDMNKVFKQIIGVMRSVRFHTLIRLGCSIGIIESSVLCKVSGPVLVALSFLSQSKLFHELCAFQKRSLALKKRVGDGESLLDRALLMAVQVKKATYKQASRAIAIEHDRVCGQLKDMICAVRIEYQNRLDKIARLLNFDRDLFLFDQSEMMAALTTYYTRAGLDFKTALDAQGGDVGKLLSENASFVKDICLINRIRKMEDKGRLMEDLQACKTLESISSFNFRTKNAKRTLDELCVASGGRYKKPDASRESELLASGSYLSRSLLGDIKLPNDLISSLSRIGSDVEQSKIPGMLANILENPDEPREDQPADPPFDRFDLRPSDDDFRFIRDSPPEIDPFSNFQVGADDSESDRGGGASDDSGGLRTDAGGRESDGRVTLPQLPGRKQSKRAGSKVGSRPSKKVIKGIEKVAITKRKGVDGTV